MSHELRTPLNSLLILSKVLAENRDKNLTGEQVKFASTVYSAGCDLLTLINDILDLSKVEAGKMPINPQDVVLSDVRDYLDQSFRPVAEHKGLGFTLSMDADLPAKVYTDTNRVHQILKNLLSNAFKFTEQGQVTMHIRTASKERRFPLETLNQADRVVAFSVKDTGIGIPQEKQRLIFEAFQQADGTTSRKYGGTGLGLTISREIAGLLGGIIEVESAPGVGSTFTLYLPQSYPGEDMSIVRADTDAGAEMPPLPADADFAEKKVLLIDDDVRNIFALTSVLESRGMRVLQAENGKTGLQKLQESPDVNLILMDTMMPEMDGLEAIKAIRRMPGFQSLPIISLTAKAMKGDREKCLEAGASDYITKPVAPEKLLSLMYQWLSTRKN
jgi:CheY-like chemotaxis protein